MTETDPLRTLGRICEDLRELKVPFCLVGGLAVSARAEVRTTRDVDLAITVDQARGYDRGQDLEGKLQDLLDDVSRG